VKVSEQAVEVEAGGRAVRLKSPGERDGYYGLYFGGHGFASASDVEFR
jgi:nitrous oxide reductase